jgi:hypothetical protein
MSYPPYLCVGLTSSPRWLTISSYPFIHLFIMSKSLFPSCSIPFVCVLSLSIYMCMCVQWCLTSSPRWLTNSSSPPSPSALSYHTHRGNNQQSLSYYIYIYIYIYTHIYIITGESCHTQIGKKTKQMLEQIYIIM